MLTMSDGGPPPANDGATPTHTPAHTPRFGQPDRVATRRQTRHAEPRPPSAMRIQLDVVRDQGHVPQGAQPAAARHSQLLRRERARRAARLPRRFPGAGFALSGWPDGEVPKSERSNTLHRAGWLGWFGCSLSFAGVS